MYISSEYLRQAAQLEGQTAICPELLQLIVSGLAAYLSYLITYLLTYLLNNTEIHQRNLYIIKISVAEEMP